jgi:predicted RNA-binding Zn ribbon-like protein
MTTDSSGRPDEPGTPVPAGGEATDQRTGQSGRQPASDPLAFRLDCGATWLNLLATSGRTFSTRPIERIATPARLEEWFALCELSPRRAPVAADVATAVALRETLRPLAMATVRRVPPPVHAAAELAEFLASHPDPVRIMTTDRLERTRPATPDEALARVAGQAVAHLTGPERHTLSICGEEDCLAVFADPGGRRHWCPSPACASRGRVRAFRARRRAAEAESAGQ